MSIKVEEGAAVSEMDPLGERALDELQIPDGVSVNGIPNGLDLAITRNSLATDPQWDQQTARIYEKLTPEQQFKLLEVYKTIENQPGSTKDLATLIKRAESSGPLLLSRDKDGTTVLEHLHALTEAPLAGSALEERRSELLASLVAELSDESRMVQGWVPECLLYRALGKESPAEYARLTAELAQNGKVLMADGETALKLDSASLEKGSELERYVKSVLEERWDTGYVKFKGERIDFSKLSMDEAVKLLASKMDDGREERGLSGRIVGDALAEKFGGGKTRGVTAFEAEEAVEAVSGRYYNRMDLWNGEYDRVSAVNEIRERVENNHQQVIISIAWPGEGNHAVTVEGVEYNSQGELCFRVRDPQGANNIKEGVVPGPPARERTRDAADQWLISVAEVGDNLKWALIDMGFDERFKGAEPERGPVPVYTPDWSRGMLEEDDEIKMPGSDTGQPSLAELKELGLVG